MPCTIMFEIKFVLWVLLQRTVVLPINFDYNYRSGSP